MTFITISEETTKAGYWHLGGSGVELWVAARTSFRASDGQLVPAGNLQKGTGLLVKKTCTLNNDLSVSVTVVTELPTTNDSIDVPTVQYVAQLVAVNSNGTRAGGQTPYPDQNTASGFSLYVYEAPVTTWADIVRSNLGTSPVNPRPTWPTYQQMVEYVDTHQGGAVPATTVVPGVGRLNYPALDSADPEFTGSNSPVVGRNSADFASLSEAVSTLGSTPTRLVVTDSFPSGATTIVPSTLRLEFVPGGSIVLGSGHTVTIKSDTRDWPIAQIFSGSGTLSFTGNTGCPVVLWQWLGAVGDNSTDDTAAMQKMLNAAGGLPILTTSNFTPKITDTLTSSGRVTIIGEGLTGNGSAPEPSFNWYGAADGVMFSFTGTEYLWLEGFSVALKAGANSAATAFKWNTTGPASKIVFNNLFVENRAVNPNTKLFYSSPTSTQNNEDVSFFSVKMLASNDDSPTGASRGYCYYQGANPNAIDITFDHCWFLDASVALSFHGGNNVAIRDSFIMESNTGIETATDVTVENVRFENVGQYAKSLGGTANWVFRKNSFNNARLTPANAAFDFSAGSVALTITDSIPLDASDPAQIWFSTTGGSSLFSENNGYPTTSALNADSFSNYWSFNDSGFSAGKLVRKLGSGVEQVIDVGTGLDGLMKFSIDGASPAIKQRVGPSSNAAAHVYENYYLNAGVTNAKDVLSFGGWDNSFTVNASDGNNHWKIIYVPAGSLTPSAAFLDIDGNGVVTIPILAVSTSQTLANAVNLILGTGTGSQVGTAVGQKLAFHGSTPVVQRASASQAAVATTGATDTTPYGYTTSAQADAIVTLLNEIRAVLVEKGIMKGSS